MNEYRSMMSFPLRVMFLMLLLQPDGEVILPHFIGDSSV